MISPEQARAARKQLDTQTRDEIERRIDADLTEYPGGATVAVGRPLPKQVIDDILKRYTDAGWKIIYEHQPYPMFSIEKVKR